MTRHGKLGLPPIVLGMLSARQRPKPSVTTSCFQFTVPALSLLHMYNVCNIVTDVFDTHMSSNCSRSSIKLGIVTCHAQWQITCHVTRHCYLPSLSATAPSTRPFQRFPLQYCCQLVDYSFPCIFLSFYSRIMLKIHFICSIQYLYQSPMSTSMITKGKRGRPLGSKDKPRPEGAPPRGRPKKGGPARVNEVVNAVSGKILNLFV
jgi:hypothetical protein